MYSGCFFVIGGDKRTYYLVSELRKRGFHVCCRDVEGEEDGNDAQKCENVVLPVPYTRDREKINGSDADICDVISQIDSGRTVFAGGVDERLKTLIKSKGATLKDYSLSEEFLQKNAIITSEGAVELLMRESEKCLFGSKVAIFGYGRIGKYLADRIKAFGAYVTVFARRTASRFEALSRGIDSLSYGSLETNIGDYDVIFNTVPSRIAGVNELGLTKRDVILIELASRPYGFDFDSAKELGRRIFLSSGIPGKVAPQSAGLLVAEEILKGMTT